MPYAWLRSLTMRGRSASDRWGNRRMGTSAPWLLLDVAGVTCALPCAAVREILPLPRLHAAPAGGGPVAGLLDLGGTPIPVIDLARLLGLREAAPDTDPYRHVVLLDEGAVAILVDRADDLVHVAPEAMRAVAPERSFNGCVAGEIALGDRLVAALAPARILSAEERERVRAFVRSAERRLAAFPPVPAA